jgi:hypothetical protein
VERRLSGSLVIAPVGGGAVFGIAAIAFALVYLQSLRAPQVSAHSYILPPDQFQGYCARRCDNASALVPHSANCFPWTAIL